MLQQQQQAKQREEEMARQRRQQEEARRMEQQSVMNCKQVLQRLNTATPENFDQVKMEIEKLILQELPKCGTQGPMVQQETQQMIQQTQMRCEQLKQQRAEEERANQQRAEEAKKVLAELAGLVEKAEQDTSKLKEVAAPVTEGKAMGEEEAREAAKAVNSIAVEAKASCKASS